MHIIFKKSTILTGKMQNYLHEISYIAYVLIHFYKELAIERSLLNRVGCVVTWVTWVRGLRGSNSQMGWVGYAGQNIFYLGHNFCVGQIYFSVDLSVGPKFLHRFFFSRMDQPFVLDEIIFLYYNELIGHFFRESLPSKSWPNPVWPLWYFWVAY